MNSCTYFTVSYQIQSTAICESWQKSKIKWRQKMLFTIRSLSWSCLSRIFWLQKCTNSTLRMLPKDCYMQVQWQKQNVWAFYAVCQKQVSSQSFLYLNYRVLRLTITGNLKDRCSFYVEICWSHLTKLKRKLKKKLRQREKWMN